MKTYWQSVQNYTQLSRTFGNLLDEAVGLNEHEKILEFAARVQQSITEVVAARFSAAGREAGYNEACENNFKTTGTEI